jgi:hypothetical protein
LNNYMKEIFFIPVLAIAAFSFSGCSEQNLPGSMDEDLTESMEAFIPEAVTGKKFDFASQDSIFRFRAVLPGDLGVEYVPEIESINIYDINSSEDKMIDKSQIFIRYFRASSFLTLNTVDILSRQEASVKGHQAVAYEIRKKEGIADFAFQPFWRNQQHKLIDIRFSSQSPTLFYVFSYNPEMTEEQFNAFIDSLAFHNDKESLAQPLEKAEERIAKKPFGIFVSPVDSPISPERFTGYHNAVDYEVFEDEKEASVPIMAVCGGKLLEKRNVAGYGGLAIQECLFENQPVVIYYGHLRLTSIKQEVGSYLLPGEQFAVLGQGFSSETDGERKHLHLGVSKGEKTDVRGYVPNKSELENWLDFNMIK